ncbi:MAG TPA: lipopolysaccharide core heptose(I) kinase RfaP, partial [Burkholderiales bacterium]|nr:lipopolysaccharide core heptose(I) kinase RfaP [Burkholderiales bacterium]
LWRMQGELYRHVEGRRTLRFERDHRSFFIKIHAGVGWGEIFKNLLTLRLPVIGARNEYLAIRYLENLGLAAPKMMAYAEIGRNPAARRSLIVTEDLGDSISLEDLCRNWPQQPPDFVAKQRLIEEVADIARRLHVSGANHRDFYLCHFLRRAADGRLYLIDLHRAQIRKRVPRRWLVKDLAGLYFSSMDVGLTQRDRLRFMKRYSGKTTRDMFGKDRGLWAAVVERGQRLYEQ